MSADFLTRWRDEIAIRVRQDNLQAASFPPSLPPSDSRTAAYRVVHLVME